MQKSLQMVLNLSLVVALFVAAGVAGPQIWAEEDAPALEVTAAPLFDPAVLEPVTPAQNVAVGCFNCQPWGTTNHFWGMGSDCTAAETNLRGQLLTDGANKCADEGYAPCGITNLVIVKACYFEGGMYKIDGYATYRCRVC